VVPYSLAGLQRNAAPSSKTRNTSYDNSMSVKAKDTKKIVCTYTRMRIFENRTKGGRHFKIKKWTDARPSRYIM
jgi:hypothetical protein